MTVTSGFRSLASALITSLFWEPALGQYQSVAYNPRSCVMVQSPTGYNFYDLTTAIVSPTLYQSIETACQQDASGMFTNPRGCSDIMTTAESQIKLMYATSDADLARIASYLFGCSASMTPALVDQIQMDASIMNTMNKTVFGDSSILPASPGLLRDIISIGDGVSQLDEVGKGQAQSVRAASTAQVTAAKSMKATIIDDSQKISDLIVQNINYLIGNRTFVQNKGFNDLTTNIEEVSNQVGNDADDIVNRFSEKYTDLSTRYEDWKMLSTAAIEDTNTKLTDIKGRVTNLLNQIASTESQF